MNILNRMVTKLFQQYIKKQYIWSCLRVLQRNRTNNIYVNIRGFLLYELVHVLMESGKLPSLPSASWKTRNIGGIIQSESKGLRIEKADGVNSDLSLKAWELGVLMSVFLFRSGAQWVGWWPPTVGRITYFSCSTIQGLIPSRNTL